MKIRMAIVCAVIVLGSWMEGVSAAVYRFGETETRTFKLTYASAVEVAERLNGQVCRELGPDGKPFRDRVRQRLGGDFGAEGPRGAVGAPAGAMNVVGSFPKGVNEK